MSRAMKDSGIPWIGEIPSHWRLFQTSTLFHEHKEKNNGLKEKNLLSLSYGQIKRKDINSSEGLLPQSFETYNIIDKGDIVFRLTDLQNDKRSLRTGLCKERGIITSAYVSVRANTEIDCRYFHYLYHSYDICKVFYGLGDGVRQGMNYDDLKKLLVFLPPIHEQQSIADFLDKKCGEIDEMVSLQERIVEELKAYKQSVITEAVCKGLNPDAPMKDSGIEWIGQIPEGWNIQPIKWGFDIIAGATPKSDNPDYWGGPIPWITPADYKTEDRYIKEGSRFLTEAGMASCSTTLLPTNSVIFSKRAPIGLVVVNQEPICTNQGCFGCVSHGDCSSYYYYAMSAFTEQYGLYGSGTTFKEISASLFADFPLPHPPVIEQQAIADYLDTKCAEINTLISLKQSKIESLKEYKKSIIYEYITGKKELNG